MFLQLKPRETKCRDSDSMNYILRIYVFYFHSHKMTAASRTPKHAVKAVLVGTLVPKPLTGDGVLLDEVDVCVVITLVVEFFDTLPVFPISTVTFVDGFTNIPLLITS